MCMFCNNNTPDSAHRGQSWVLSAWHVVTQSESEDVVEVGICSDGPHQLPDFTAFSDKRQAVEKLAEKLALIGVQVAIDGRASTDGYLVGYTGQLHEPLFGPQTFEREIFFLIHPVGTDPMKIYQDIQAITAMELSLRGEQT